MPSSPMVVVSDICLRRHVSRWTTRSKEGKQFIGITEEAKQTRKNANDDESEKMEEKKAEQTEEKSNNGTTNGTRKGRKAKHCMDDIEETTAAGDKEEDVVDDEAEADEENSEDDSEVSYFGDENDTEFADVGDNEPKTIPTPPTRQKAQKYLHHPILYLQQEIKIHLPFQQSSKQRHRRRRL